MAIKACVTLSSRPSHVAEPLNRKDKKYLPSLQFESYVYNWIVGDDDEDDDLILDSRITQWLNISTFRRAAAETSKYLRTKLGRNTKKTFIDVRI
jgi:hypothetical protein